MNEKDTEPFDPLRRSHVPGTTDRAIKRRMAAEAQERDAEDLEAHMGLENGRIMRDEERLDRMDQWDRVINRRQEFEDFPEISDRDLATLQKLIKRHGLPLLRMEPELARWVVRRGVYAWQTLRAVERRRTQKSLFRPEELIEVMRVLHVHPSGFADMIAPPSQHVAARQAINRWLHGLNPAHGAFARAAERLINEHVRHLPKRGGFPIPGRMDDVLPQTLERRQRAERAVRRMDVPLARAAQEAAERERKERYERRTPPAQMGQDTAPDASGRGLHEDQGRSGEPLS